MTLCLVSLYDVLCDVSLCDVSLFVLVFGLIWIKFKYSLFERKIIILKFEMFTHVVYESIHKRL